jgi:hypothetical protein
MPPGCRLFLLVLELYYAPWGLRVHRPERQYSVNMQEGTPDRQIPIRALGLLATFQIVSVVVSSHLPVSAAALRGTWRARTMQRVNLLAWRR